MNPFSRLQDIRMALRSMMRERGFTVAALLSLALGIGATTALFSVVYGVLLRPLPYPGSDQLIRLSEFHPGANAGVPGPLFTNITYNAWSEPRSIEGIGGFSADRFLDTTFKEPVKIAGTSMTPSAFRLLGVRPALGRLFVEEDGKEGSPEVAVVSYGLWKGRFGGEPSAIGRTLTLDGKPHTIVGVTPEGFYFPERDGRVFTAMRMSPGSADPNRQSISVFGAIARLKPGFTPEQAAEEGSLVARGVKRPPVADAIFGKGGPVAIKAESILQEMTGRIRPALMLFAVGVGFVLLIACSNVASLQLTRGVSRQREIAIRTALGASRGRLVSQLVTESLVLALVGGALGVGLGAALLKALPALAPANFPRLDEIALDATALTFAALVSAFAGLGSGLLPALRSSYVSLAPALRDGAGASAGVATQRLRAGLVVAEAALAVMLLIGAGLLARSFGRLIQVDPGYDTRGVLIARLDPGPEERSPEAALALSEAVLDRVRSLPGVVVAGVGNMAPFEARTAIASFDLPRAGAPEGKVKARATSYVMTPGFAEALSLRLKEGRLLGPQDTASSTDSILVNEEFARVYFNDGKPVIGRQFVSLFGNQSGVTSEIVGVVSNLLKNGLDQKPLTEMFALPRFGRRFSGGFQLAIRIGGDPVSLAPSVRAAIREIDPSIMVDTVTLASRVSASLAQPRFAALTVAAFALLALTLAAAGLYGAMSYSVTQRRRELGVRSALGASRGDIVALILRQGLTVAVLGLWVGILASLSLSKLLDRLLFGVTAQDPVTFLIAPVLLLIAAALACLVPAWRGAGVEPTEALRCE